MIAQLEALAALHRHGTMTRAATRLRITQSAVSKRIAALEHELGAALVERTGRKVQLTAEARDLLARTQPLLSELRATIAGRHLEQDGTLVVGVSESILSSWGPALLARVQQKLSGVDLILNSHRSPVALDAVRSGEYMLALIGGGDRNASDLVHEPVAEEPMVIVPSGDAPLRLRTGTELEVLTIEPQSETWRAIREPLQRLEAQRRIRVRPAQVLQSYASIVQMARAGFAPGLVPLGIARALGVRQVVRLPRPGVARPVSLVGRPYMFQRPVVQRVLAQLVRGAAQAIG